MSIIVPIIERILDINKLGIMDSIDRTTTKDVIKVKLSEDKLLESKFTSVSVS